MKTLFSRPEMAWLIGTLIACALLVPALFLPLWKMELVAPQYPAGLTMHAYGDHFQGDTSGYYKGFDAVREINSLNHYIGMKPIKSVTEMDLFVPGLVAAIAGAIVVAFIAWKRTWFRALVTAGFWFIPIFFVVDLQYWLYDYGHSMDPHAALNTGDITPKVVGTTQVWNFHSENGFEIGFYLMLTAAAAISFIPPLIRLVESRRHRAETTVNKLAPQARSASTQSKAV